MKTRRKDSLPVIFAITMSVVMVLSSLGLETFAKGNSYSSSEFISSFATLDEDIAVQYIAKGAKESSIVFPESLGATVECLSGDEELERNLENIELTDIDWEIDVTKSDWAFFTSKTAGAKFVYVPAISFDTYIVLADLPEICVYIGDEPEDGLSFEESADEATDKEVSDADETEDDDLSGEIPDKKNDRSGKNELSNPSYDPTLTMSKSDKNAVIAADDTQTVADVETDEIEEVPFERSMYSGDLYVTVTADPGVFPEDTYMIVTPVTDLQDACVSYAIKQEREADRKVAYEYTVDITLFDSEGNEIEPDTSKGSVYVSFQLGFTPDELLSTDVYHISNNEDGSLAADRLESEYVDDCTLLAETDGFSIYCVEFTYDGLSYAIAGDETVSLRTVLDALGITGEEITEVLVSNSSLFTVSNETGEWIITPIQAFDSEEWMYVTIDGAGYEIVVTDDTIADPVINMITADNEEITGVVDVVKGESVSLGVDAIEGDTDSYIDTYKWYTCNASGGSETAIDGADYSYYDVDTTDLAYGKHYYVCKVTAASIATDDDNNPLMTKTKKTAVITINVIKPLAEFTVDPAAVTGLEYNKAAQELITAGESDDGTVKYCVKPATFTGTLKDTDYTATLPKATNAGDYKVFVMIAGDSDHSNLYVEDPIEVSIAKLTINPVTITPEKDKYTYTGSEIKPSVTVKYTDDDGKTVTIDKAEYTVTYTDNKNIGTSATITVTSKETSNYEFTGDATFEITKATHKDEALKVNVKPGAVTAATSLIDLSKYLVTGATVSVVDASTSLTDLKLTIANETSIATDKKITYTKEACDANKTGKITLEVSSDNYETYKIVINLTAISKNTEHKMGTGSVPSSVTAVNSTLSSYTDSLTDTDVTVTMTVTPKSASDIGSKATTINTAIKKYYAGVEDADLGKEYVDITVTKTVSGGTPTAVTDLGRVIEIELTCSLAGKYNVNVYRDHDNTVSKLVKLSSRATGNYSDGSCYVDTAANKVYIYSRYYSIYTLAYTTKSSHIVTYDDTQGNKTEIVATDGSKLTKPTDPTKTGYTFAGWYKDGKEWNFDSDTVSGDMTLTAQWKDKNATDASKTSASTGTGTGSSSGSGDTSRVPKTGDTSIPYTLMILVLLLGLGFMVYGICGMKNDRRKAV